MHDPRMLVAIVLAAALSNPEMLVIDEAHLPKRVDVPQPDFDCCVSVAPDYKQKPPPIKPHKAKHGRANTRKVR